MKTIENKKTIIKKMEDGTYTYECTFTYNNAKCRKFELVTNDTLKYLSSFNSFDDEADIVRAIETHYDIALVNEMNSFERNAERNAVLNASLIKQTVASLEKNK